MKFKNKSSAFLISAFRISVFGFLAAAAWGQTPIITSQNGGQLTFTNLSSNLEYRIQWSGTQTGAVRDLFNDIEYVTPTSTVAVSVDIPLFLRVATTNRLSNGIYRLSEQLFNLPMGTNAKVVAEWSESSGGPWSTNWGVSMETTSTGTFMVVPTPHFLRINFVNCPSNYHQCVNWTDATAPGADRTNTFLTPAQQYSKPCLKIKVGQGVTFSGNFGLVPLSPACQECSAMTNTAGFIGSHTFNFEKPGFFGYYGQGWGFPEDGQGTAGNIWVIP
jgi:hypothetical protein